MEARTDTDATIGTRVGSYTITAKLGQGGMGAVYLAQHPLLERKAAVKILLPELSSHKDSVDRFFHEARTTARLRHPAMVDVYDYGTLPDGRAYLIMDFLEGECLEVRMRTRGALPAAEALRIARDVALGVSVAHAEQIVHRDLKPDNLFLLPPLPGSLEERVKILDFGIAKLAPRPGELAPGVTRAGALLGTPLYMSPEQCRGTGEVDARADIYSLGCILFAMLAGRPPFASDSMAELLAAHLVESPPFLTSLGVDVPDAVDALVQAMLAKSPGQRPRSMVLVAEDLDRLLRAAGSAPSRNARTLSLGTHATVSTRRGRPNHGSAPSDAITVVGETLEGRSLSERGQHTVGPPSRWPRMALVVSVAMVVAGGGVAMLVPRIERPTQFVGASSAPPAVERAVVPPARAVEPPPAPAETPAPPAVPEGQTVEADPAAPATVTTARKSRGEGRRTGRPAGASRSARKAAAPTTPSATEAPATPPPQEAKDKNGRPIYRGTQLQIEKNDPYR